MSEPTREQIDAVLREFADLPSWVESINSPYNHRRMAAEILTLRTRLADAEREIEYGDTIINGQAALLTGVVTAIRGEPDPLSAHSHHDAPELVRALVAEADRLRAVVEAARAFMEARKYVTETPPWEAEFALRDALRALDGGDDA